MRHARTLAIVFLTGLAVACLLADQLAPSGYEHQYRDIPGAGPSRQHLLGTDDMGRDRFARVLYGTRVSLLLAPTAAFISTLLAVVIGGTAGLVAGWLERSIVAAIDLVLSLPWLFLLIAVRALLPLNVSPLNSAMITFAILGCLGWAAAARLISAHVHSVRASDFMLLARACGSGGFRLLGRQLLPNLMPLLRAQFWISIPAFILAEANLGVLGLGVSEPLPSWGSLLRELESYSGLAWNPCQLVPLVLLVAVVGCFHFLVSDGEVPA